MMLDVLQENNSLKQSICFDWKTTINLGWINHRLRYEISKVGWKMFWLDEYVKKSNQHTSNYDKWIASPKVQYSFEVSIHLNAPQLC